MLQHLHIRALIDDINSLQAPYRFFENLAPSSKLVYKEFFQLFITLRDISTPYIYAKFQKHRLKNVGARGRQSFGGQVLLAANGLTKIAYSKHQPLTILKIFLKYFYLLRSRRRQLPKIFVARRNNNAKKKKTGQKKRKVREIC